MDVNECTRHKSKLFVSIRWGFVDDVLMASTCRLHLSQPSHSHNISICEDNKMRFHFNTTRKTLKCNSNWIRRHWWLWWKCLDGVWHISSVCNLRRLYGHGSTIHFHATSVCVIAAFWLNIFTHEFSSMLSCRSCVSFACCSHKFQLRMRKSELFCQSASDEHRNPVRSGTASATRTHALADTVAGCSCESYPRDESSVSHFAYIECVTHSVSCTHTRTTRRKNNESQLVAVYWFRFVRQRVCWHNVPEILYYIRVNHNTQLLHVGELMRACMRTQSTMVVAVVVCWHHRRNCCARKKQLKSHLWTLRCEWLRRVAERAVVGAEQVIKLIK